MGYLKVKFNSDYLGPLLLETDPGGLDELEIQLLRSKESDGLMYVLTLNLDFFKEGRNYIKSVYDTIGIEAKIFVTVFDYNPNDYTWDEIFIGQINLDNYEEQETLVKTNIEQVGFNRNFVSATEIDYDVETLLSLNDRNIPATPVLEQTYHSKKILKLSDVRPGQDVTFYNQPGALDFMIGKCVVGPCYNQQGAVIYGQIETTDQKIADVTDMFSIPFGFAPSPLNANNIAQHFHNVNYAIGDTVTFGPDIYTAILPSLGIFPPNPTYWAKGLIEVARYNKNPRNPFYQAVDAGVADFEISLKLKHHIAVSQFGGGGDIDVNWPCSSSSKMAYREVKCFYEHRDASDNILDLVQFGDWTSIKGCGGLDSLVSNFETKTLTKNGVNVSVGDKFYVYYLVGMWAEYKKHGGLTIDVTLSHDFAVTADKSATYIKIVNKTTGIADTDSKSVLVFEALKKGVEWATGETDSFKSSILGRTDSDPAYPSDGELSLLMLTNGENLRNSANSIIFTNFNDLFQSLNSFRPLGWGFEVEDGKNYVVVEGKEYFYDVNTITLQLTYVPDDLKKVSDRSRYFNQLDIGYPKIEVEQSNGIDEYNTTRQYSLQYTVGKGKQQQLSLYRTSGFEIENQRRLNGRTEDSKLDPENFLTAMVRSASPSGYDTERNQLFPEIINVFDPDSVYNIRYTPRRNLQRWARILASATLKLRSSLIKFASGTYNYQAASREVSEVLVLSEDASLDVSQENPIWIPEIFTFEAPISINDWRAIRSSPYGVIRFTATDGITYSGFILSVKYKVVIGKGEFELLRAFIN